MNQDRHYSHPLREACRKLWWQSRVIDLMLWQVPVKALHPIPPDLGAGEATVGQQILQGTFQFYGESFEIEPPKIWFPYGISEDALAALHQFEWLRALRAVGDHDARVLSRALVSDWIQSCRRWHPIAWRADVMGQRLALWLGHYDFFGASADSDFRHHFYRSIARQSLYLRLMLTHHLPPEQYLIGLLGLIASQLAVPGQEKRLHKSLLTLQKVLRQQILPDGMHMSRNPAFQAVALQHLLRLRTTLRQGYYGDYPFVHSYIELMSPALRLFRHGDGALAVFQGGGEGVSDWLDMLVGPLEGRYKSIERLPEAGFERISAQKTLLIADMGAERSKTEKIGVTAGGAFEFSYGRQRVVINCGKARGGYQRFVAADFNQQNASTLTFENHGPGHRESYHRDYQEGAHLLSFQQEWWGHQARHQRYLYMAPEGHDIRGQDRIWSQKPTEWAIRFHFHPAIKVLPTTLPTLWNLQLPEGEVWHFYCSDEGRIRLEENCYLGQSFQPCQTLLIEGHGSGGEAQMVKWAFKYQVDE